MKVAKVFVNGKVILVGEHAVVYGKMALATSIGIGVRVEVSQKKNYGESSNYPNDDKGLIKKAIELAGGDENLEIKIISDLPVGSGFGSSAAAVAAVIRGVSEYLGNTLTDDEVFNLTMECEKIAHGNPSGIDPVTVVYGGLISFTKGQPFEHFKIKKPLKLLLVNSGKPIESTKEIIELVASNPNKEAIVDEIAQLAIVVREKLISGGEIGELINQNGVLLEELGVVGENAKILSKKLRDLGCSVKITGAGGMKTGSGMMIVMSNDLTKTKELLDNEQIKYFETTIGEK